MKTEITEKNQQSKPNAFVSQKSDLASAKNQNLKNDSYVQIWNSLLDEGHLQNILDSFKVLLNQDKVIHYKSASDRVKDDYTLPQKGQSLSATVESLKDYIHTAVNTQSPYFLNQLYGGAHPIAVLSEFVAAFMNTSMATYEIAPVASVMEHEVLNALKNLMGWKDVDGIFVPGGSYANMMALHLARFKIHPQAKATGHDPKLQIYVSDQAHYSMKKSAHLLGFGEDAVKVIPSDHNYKMSIKVLKEQIEKDIASGLRPCLVMSTLGTTVFGAVDPISEIQKVCDQYQIWHHVDAAWGGPLVFASQPMQTELQSVDSVSYDFHKFFGAGLTKAVFVTAHSQLMSLANSCVGTQYIFHEDEDSFFDTGVKAIQCGRKVDALTLWTLWRHLGLEGLQNYVHKFLELKDVAVRQVKDRGFALIHEPEFLNICFKLPTDQNTTKIQADELHRIVRQSLIKQGNVYVNYSSDEKQGVFFRLVLNHLRLDSDIIHNAFDIIEQAWKDQIKNEEYNG